MNPKPLAEAKDDDVRQALRALQRAAVRAKKIAAQTQTAVVVMRGGVMIHEQLDNDSMTLLAEQGTDTTAKSNNTHEYIK